MSLFVILRVALKALARNKMRTALTMLGMIIGVAAVITMVALGNGAQEQIAQQAESAGTNLVSVRAGNHRRGGISLGVGNAPTLKVADVEAIRNEVSGIVYMAASVNTRDQVVVGGQNWSAQIEGTDVEFPQIRHWDLEYGTFFTEAHVRGAAKVAVLGSIVRDNLFGEGHDPVGARLRIRDQSFQVIGVLESKGAGQFGQDQDDMVVVPYTTVQKKLRGRDGTNISGLTISAVSVDQMEEMKEQISEVLRIQHQLLPGEDDDFMVRTQEDMVSFVGGMAETMTRLLAGIAGVSLLVGGIGIMNIMLVSVTERTREIGLRMAVGAKGGDVLMQFLVEAVVLCIVGGLIGVALGYAASEAITRVLQWPTAVPLDAVGIAVGVAATIGIFFGFYPARKAARLDPIESLRFE